MTIQRSSRDSFVLALLAGLSLTLGQAFGFDVCGNGICATTANPPETCATCSEDCGPCPPEFSDLLDSSDSKSGRIVAGNIRIPFENRSHPDFGQERFGSQLSIAVDPTNSARVYVAWGDFQRGLPPYTLHVRRSDDRGATWGTVDVLTVVSATNPALAVNSVGTVALLYQKVNPYGATLPNQRWETHLRRSTNLGTTWSDLLLADTPANEPVAQFVPYLGDYLFLQAVGKDFYGTFAASNVPNLANFPQGVVYQRRANFATQQLIQNDGVSVAQPSIDPFFFRVLEP